jgi:hypothetical protein
LQSLVANNYTLKTSPAYQGNDAAKRIEDLIGECDSAGEALMISASHFRVSEEDMDGSLYDNAVKACSAIIVKRRRQYGELQQRLYITLQRAEWLSRNNKLFCAQYPRWKDGIKKPSLEKGGSIGDSNVRETTLQMIESVKESYSSTPLSSLFQTEAQFESNLAGKAGKARKTVNEDGIPILPLEGKARRDALQDVCEDLEVMVIEWVRRARSLRFLQACYNIQDKAASGNNKVFCDGCGDSRDLRELKVLSSCGHVVCNSCLVFRSKDHDLQCPSTGCEALHSDFQVIAASDFKSDNVDYQGDKHWGAKITKLLNLLENITKGPKKEQAILFVQSQSFTKIIEKALRLFGISFTSLVANKDRDVSEVLSKFQKNDGPKRFMVLMLNIGDVSAAGR